MSTQFKLQARVRQVMSKPIEGVIVDFIPDRSEREFRNEVAWLDEAGVEHRKVFDDSEIELIPDPAEPNPNPTPDAQAA